ncbi:hypothetical protein QUA20_20610 [Microcoleus sp. Pol7_A1]
MINILSRFIAEGRTKKSMRNAIPGNCLSDLERPDPLGGCQGGDNANKFLELAVSGNANVIVTGDLDLLVLNPFQAVEILPPIVKIGDIKDD